MSKTLAEILENNRTLVQNAESDNDIKVAITPYGYTAEELQGGVALYIETENLFADQAKEKQDVREVSKKFIEMREIAEDEYSIICELCRVAFRKTPALHSLVPSVLDYSPFDNWKLGAFKLYDSISKNQKALELLLRYGTTVEVLQLRMDELNGLEQLKNQRSIEKGEAQQATKDRNEKMEELKDYCRDLEAIARIALKEKPQLLEKLGILVR